MLRRITMIASSLLALLLFTVPAWTFPVRGGHGPSMGSMPHGSFAPSVGRFSSTGAFANGSSFSPATSFQSPVGAAGIGFNNRFFSPITVGAIQPFSPFVNPAVTQFGGRVNPFSAPFGVGVGFNPAFTPSNLNALTSSFGSVQSFNPSTRSITTTTPFGSFNSGFGSPTGVSNVFNPATRTVMSTTPFGSFASNFTASNPANFVSPLANPAFSQSAYNHTLRQVEREALWGNYNPYLYGGYGYGNPYAAYSTPYYGIGSSYGAGSGYGAGAPSVGAANNAYSAPATTDNVYTAQPRKASPLTAFGVPVEFGEVKWPLALRLMPPDTKRDLLDKLESQMKIAATQAVSGNASQVLLRETKNTIDSVKWWLKGRRSNMSENTYQDGDTFLRNLEDSLHRMDS